jgi:hypothetical protein
MLDFSANIRNGKGTKGMTFGQIKPFNRPNQSNTADLQQVIIVFGALVYPVVNFFANESDIKLYKLITEFF